MMFFDVFGGRFWGRNLQVVGRPLINIFFGEFFVFSAGFGPQMLSGWFVPPLNMVSANRERILADPLFEKGVKKWHFGQHDSMHEFA